MLDSRLGLVSSSVVHRVLQILTRVLDGVANGFTGISQLFVGANVERVLDAIGLIAVSVTCRQGDQGKSEEDEEISFHDQALGNAVAVPRRRGIARNRASEISPVSVDRRQ